MKNEIKLSHLSRKLDLTVTEASRHLQRLSEAKLIQKNLEGMYGLTQFGRLVLFMLEDLDFVSEHREYFLEYDASGIPRQLIKRLDDLQNSTYISGALRSLEEGERNIREAKEFVWILSDDVLANTIPVLAEKIKPNFDLRIILPDGKFAPETVSRLPLGVAGVQKRVLAKVNVLVVMTESYAVLCLPNRSGKIDYTGFAGKDDKFQKWCKDLFLHYWDKAKPTIPQ